MTNKEYRQDPGISRSNLFEMRKSPLHFQYQMTHPKEDTPALLIGRALHKMILEPGDFESEFAVCPTVNRRTKAGQEQYAAFMAENEGKDIVSQDDYEVMCEMAEVINKHQLAKKLLTGEHEQSFFWTDPDTGEVKAMVSYPSYNNNRLANGIDSSYYASLNTDLSSPMLNRATQSRTAPGSTFKPISSTAVLEEGVANASTYVKCTGIFDKISPAAKCWIYPNAHGSLNVSGAIAVSCNFFFYQMGYNLGTVNGTYNSQRGLTKLKKYASMYGFNRKSGVEITEYEPHISDEDAIRSAIGQGTNNMTAISLARYVTALATDGKLYTFRLLSKICDANGNVIEELIPEGEQIEHKMLSSAIEKAQQKIENNNYGIRENLLKYDEVNNEQREIIYKERRQVLDGENMRDAIYKMITDIVDNAVDMCFSEDVDSEEWDLNEFNSVLRQIIPIEPLTAEKVKGKKKNEMKHLIKEEAVKLYEAKESEFPEPEQLRELERVILLKSIDSKWMDHIDDMEILRQGIGLTAYGQRDPVVEYKMAAFDMFNSMITSIQEDTVRMLYHVHVEQKIEREQVAKVTGTNKDDSSVRKPVQRKEIKVYPNDPCPCGSGKKYKQCCGRKTANV